MRKIVWFARGSGIGRAGPFANQIEAAAAMELDNGYGKPYNFATWPEYETEKDEPKLKLKAKREMVNGRCAVAACLYGLDFVRYGICNRQAKTMRYHKSNYNNMHLCMLCRY